MAQGEVRIDVIGVSAEDASRLGNDNSYLVCVLIVQTLASSRRLRSAHEVPISPKALTRDEIRVWIHSSCADNTSYRLHAHINGSLAKAFLTRFFDRVIHNLSAVSSFTDIADLPFFRTNPSNKGFTGALIFTKLLPLSCTPASL